MEVGWEQNGQRQVPNKPTAGVMQRTMFQLIQWAWMIVKGPNRMGE